MSTPAGVGRPATPIQRPRSARGSKEVVGLEEHHGGRGERGGGCSGDAGDPQRGGVDGAGHRSVEETHVTTEGREDRRMARDREEQRGRRQPG